MTAYTIAHGVGGLWEVHQWNGGVELQHLVDWSDVVIRDQIAVTKITGLHSLPDRDDPRDPKVARVGETAHPRNVHGVTATYEGELRATTVPLLRSQRTTLLAAFAATTNEGYMDVIPSSVIGGPTARFNAMPMQLEIADEITNSLGLFRREFLLGLRLSDPRKYFPSLAVDETGDPVSVTNTGDAPVDPVITIAGASGDVTVTDGTHTLTFANVPSGSLVIDFAARTAKVGTDNAELVVASSDWWDRFTDGIAGGATVSIAQTGGTGVQVQFTPATWG